MSSLNQNLMQNEIDFTNKVDYLGLRNEVEF